MTAIQLTVFFMVIYVLESLTIMVQSGLIVVMLGREWAQVKRMSPVDMILISLGFCRFFLQCSSVLFNFGSHFHLDWVLWYVSVVWEFTNTLSFWLISLLAIVYCVRVSSFAHPIFRWLRWRILRLVPWLLLGSLFMSCVTAIFSSIRHHNCMKVSSMVHFFRNNTVVDRLKTSMQNFIISELVFLSIPFLLFVASTILLIASLSQHLGQMQHHSTGHCNSGMKAQCTVLRFLTIFLVFFTSYFLTVLITFVTSRPEETSWFWMWETIIYAVVCIHSTSIMLSNPKLKKVLKVRWGCLETA